MEDLSQYIKSCRVNVVPTRYAAGIPLKLLEAMSYGIPTVASSIIAGQLHLADSQQVLIAQNKEEFASKVIQLYSDEELWKKLQTNSINYIKDNYSREVMTKSLDKIIKKCLSVRGDKTS